LGRDGASSGRPSADDVVSRERESVAYTFCDACNQIPFCGVKAALRNGRIVGLEGWENYPSGPPCAKAYATVQEEYHPDRLLYPMIRVGPKDSAPRWRTATWDEALDLIAGRLREVREKYGPESVLFYVGDPKEPRLAVSRLASAFGSPNFGTESSTCSRAASLASQLLFGLRAWGTPPSERTRGVVIWAMNTAWTNTQNLRRLVEAKRRGAKFLVVDPRRTPTSERLADLHLRPRPGTDGALALGMINALIKGGLYDGEFVSRWIHGFDALRDYVSGFTPKEVERITWVPAGEVEEAAELLASSVPGTIFLGYSTLTHTTNGVQNVRAILTLMAILGNLDVPGGIVIPTHPLVPYLAMTDYPLRKPGDALLMDIDFALMSRKMELRDKRADADRFPVWAELVPEQIQVNMLPEYVREGRIRAALLFGANLTMWPQYGEYQEAIRSLEFAAAVDYFYRPWTHDFVDVVLPAATMYERTEPFAAFPAPGGWRIYRRDRALEPRGEARSDWWIAFRIAVGLGLGDLFWGGDTEAAMDWILGRAAGISLRDVPIPEGRLVPTGPEEFRKYERGLLREDGRPGFPTPTGKVEVWSTILEKHGFDPLPVYVEPEESPVSRPDLAGRYPLVLITGSRSPVYTHSKHRELPWLREMEPEPLARMNPDDAAKRGIGDGDRVVVETAHGSVGMRVRLTYMMPPGIVDIPHGWAAVPGANANDATPRSFDPISGYPSFKALLCEVRRAGDGDEGGKGEEGGSV
ncbi:MAG: molybdopterin-dependent oxidoreductase, partial [Nitrososphaeria archaeon]